MIARLKPYSAMKDSAEPWLGDIPGHWEARRTKALLRERVQKGFPDEPLLAATQTKGVVRKEKYENRTVLALKDLHLLKLVHAGDFVISLRSFQGGIEYAREQGIISSAYTVLYPVQASTRSYLAWLFKSRPYVENLSLYVTGIRQGQNIDYEKLGRSKIPMPPRPEQAAIVRFLDYMDRRIRRFIRAKQKLVKLLEEQKQVIIHRAVTRGLDPNVRLKPSGVEWLGDVPEHWEVVPLKYLALRIQNGATPPTSEPIFHENGTIPWFGPSSCGPPALVGTPVRYLAEVAFTSGRARFIHGPALLVVVIGATAGRTALLTQDGATNQQITSYELRTERTNPSFALHQIRRAERWLRSTASTATIPIVDSGEVSRLPVAIPSLAEQETIVCHADNATTKLTATINYAQQEIVLLKEYRTRLIADVVTGKLDVREVAARLPDEADESELPDESDAMTDSDDIVDCDIEAESEEAEA